MCTYFMLKISTASSCTAFKMFFFFRWCGFVYTSSVLEQTKCATKPSIRAKKKRERNFERERTNSIKQRCEKIQIIRANERKTRKIKKILIRWHSDSIIVFKYVSYNVHIATQFDIFTTLFTFGLLC